MQHPPSRRLRRIRLPLAILAMFALLANLAPSLIYTFAYAISSSNWSYERARAQDFLGWSVATAGDVNGDGFSDTIVGATGFDGVYANGGAAFLFFGSPSGLSATPVWSAEGEQADSSFGTTVATAGDVNGDSYADVLISAPGYSNNAGRAYLYLGGPNGLATTPAWSRTGPGSLSGFGTGLATAGDVNGDGYSDVIVGAPSYVDGQGHTIGLANLYLGGPEGLSFKPGWNQIGAVNDTSSFGQSVATAGDVNGDGYADILVGAPSASNGETNEGAAYLYLGGPNGPSIVADWTVESNLSAAKLGTSVATVGDTNGDGFADLVVGAPELSNGQAGVGRASLYLGGTAGPDTIVDWSVEGDQPEMHLGWTVGTAGDVNSDGYADLAVSASGTPSQTPSGTAFLYLGGSSGLNLAPALSVHGESGSSFGRSAATAGDVNGDGFSDLVVGSPDYTTAAGLAQAGRVDVFLGRASALETSASWSAVGGQRDARFGTTVQAAGDVNGDGYSDVIVGSPFYSSGELNEGRVLAYLGSATGLSATAAWMVQGGLDNAIFGQAIGSAGDVNGDGYDDVIVGSPISGGGNGHALVFLGSANGLATTASWTVEGAAYSRFGYAVGTAGDVNGDGFSDIIISAPNFGIRTTTGSIGQIHVYLGGAGGLSGTPAWTMDGDQANAEFGVAVGTAGDVNGDGFSDVIIGASGYTDDQLLPDKGRAFVYLGGPTGLSRTPAWTASGSRRGEQFGSSVATAGDVNGDSFSDVIIGAPTFGTQGRTYVYVGSAPGLGETPAWTVNGSTHRARFGTAVTTAGDVNGDGFSDVTVGAPLLSNGPDAEGAAFVYLGAASGLSQTSVWGVEGELAGANFGISVASAGDVNGDGFSDLVVGAGGYSEQISYEGGAFVYLGNASAGRAITPHLRRGDGATPIAHLGQSDSEVQAHLATRGLSPFGRGKVRLEWEVRPLGVPLTGVPTGQSTWVDSGTTGTILDELVEGLSSGAPYTWQTRLRYDAVSTPFLPGGRWMHQPWAGPRETAFRAADLTPPTVSVAQALGQADPAEAGPVRFTVSFDEDVFGFGDDPADLTLGGTAAPSAAIVSGGPRIFTVTVSALAYPGTVTLAVPSGAAHDRFSNPNLTATLGDNTVTISSVPPVATGVTLADRSPTRADEIHFTVTFAEPVTGLDSTDFSLVATSVTGAIITGISGSGMTWTVTVATGSGSGGLRLYLLDDNTIKDKDGNPLGGAGVGDGAYSSGQAYILDRTAPIVVKVHVDSPAQGTTALTLTVTYSDNLALSAASLGDGDIVVSGPGSYSQQALFVAVGALNNGMRTATYRIPAPGGSWGSEDAGNYMVRLAENAVEDTAGNQAAAGHIAEVSITRATAPNSMIYLPFVKRLSANSMYKNS